MSNNEKWPKRYRAEHIEPGIISYEDVDQGKVFVSNEALNRMNDSYIGRPVVNFLHEDLTPEQAFKLNDNDLESQADGVVYDVGKMDNGWYYCDMMIWDEETQKNIEDRDFSISCAYTVDEVGPSGQYHGIDYDEEVTEGTYTHMAVVDNPRYERAKIYELPTTYQNATADQIAKVLYNSKEESNKMAIFKFLSNSKKKNQNQEPPPDPKKDDDEVVNMGADSYIEVENGEQVPVSELVAAYKSMKDNAGGDDDTMMNMEDMVDVDGEQVSVKDLYDAYNSANQNKNAEPPQDVVAEPMVKENQKPVAKATPENPEKKNKNFKLIKNAAGSDFGGVEPALNTKQERLKRGKERYTLKKGGE